MNTSQFCEPRVKARSILKSSTGRDEGVKRTPMNFDHQTAETDIPFFSKWIPPLLWAALAILVQLPLFDRSIVPMDEGHLLTTADAMLDGRHLYTDLHTGIFPGIYLIASGLLNVFGREVLVTRWAAVGVNVVTVVALWQIGRRCMAPRWAALAPFLHLLLIMVAFPTLSMFNYSTVAISFGVVSLTLLLRYLDEGEKKVGLLLGLFIAAAALTKQNFGALIFLSLLISLVWNRKDSALREQTWMQTFFPIVLSGAGLTLSVVIYFLYEGSLVALVDSTLLSIVDSQFSHFNNPIPPILGPHPVEDGRFLFLYTPPTVFNALLMGEEFSGLKVTPWLRTFFIRASYGIPIITMLIAPILFALSSKHTNSSNRRASRSILLFAILFSFGIFPSAIWSHLAFVMIPILLLFGFCADRIESLLRERDLKVMTLLWRNTIAVMAILATFVGADSSRSIRRWNPKPLELERAKGLYVSPRSHALITGSVHFLDRCAPEGAPVLALPDIPIVYFLAERPNPSPFDLAIPGAVDTQMIISRAEQAGVRCVILNPQIYPEFPPLYELYPRLHRYLAGTFQAAEIIQGGDSRWLGMVRRSQ